MITVTVRHALLGACVLTATLVGCKRQNAPKDSLPPETAETPARPTGAPPVQVGSGIQADPHRGVPGTPESAGPPGTAHELKLAGLSMTVPKGWGAPTRKTGQFSAKTILNLPKAEGDPADGTVEITHFPGMKGMDQRNLDRWIASVQREDGSAFTRDTAAITVSEFQHIRLTVVDLTGIVKASMFGSSSGLTDHRMISAIVDHPRGPHFVKIVGPANTMGKWATSIDAFLKSAKVN